ncbi:DUF625-domain-containing protein [Trichodelitschia bisporula]|uniref:DUF625-domain-containing protein n=1 Tax=Trichodelitschia bisporula TaxID=703511 RepID=A0A6G1HXS5_9PEZI|nr:DUF625-domain-containing protein [Trichodelitschia bisporula]
MALVAPPAHERKRVKVYELRSNDWFDRGTGFCTGHLVNEEARIHVESEDDPARILLDARISREDGYQKQQDTLIVWTDANVTDMALSFQEPEGCAAIWEFVSEAQQRLGGGPVAGDGLSDDVMDSAHSFSLPPPELGNLPDIENAMRQANATAQGRDAMAKFVVSADYIAKLVPLVEMAEDLESLVDLHRLCNMMKTLILLNDTSIMEYVVTDEVILGVVGALEYDPDFPSHKANHRQYLADPSRFKEVVKWEDPVIRRKIHHTYRLLYLKDVVMARILDDPTFGVLNSLIFFNQVDIVQYVQNNAVFLRELFGLFGPQETDVRRKKEAVMLIQQCCQIAKNLQANARQMLYSSFITSGLFSVITFALKHVNASIRMAGAEILMALIEHDSLMLRGQIFKAIQDQTKPLTDTLIELLLAETDLGVKSHMADAIKILLDPTANTQSMEAIGRQNVDFFARFRSNSAMAQPENFGLEFYTASAKKLFRPLRELEGRESMRTLTQQEIALYSHLVEVLWYFVRQHSLRSRGFLEQENLSARVAQLMQCPEKHLKLTALKYFRVCIGLHDPFYSRQITANRLFEPVLDIVDQTMARDNLLNSACLELFEFIKRENMKDLVLHLVENYQERLERITYVPTFRELIDKYEQYIAPPPENLSFTSVETEATPLRLRNSGHFTGLAEPDPVQAAYFEEGDDGDENAEPPPPATNGSTPVKPLVDYPEDDDEPMDILAGDMTSDPSDPAPTIEAAPPSTPSPPQNAAPSPPERVAEKRRREEDDDDELGKLTAQPKRRSSSSSLGSATGVTAASVGTGMNTRRKKGLGGKDGGAGKKISISLAVKSGEREGA